MDMDTYRPSMWTRLWATLRRRPPRDPDARLSPAEVEAVTDRINTRLADDLKRRAAQRQNRRPATWWEL